MRYIPLLLLLASCQTWGWSETADALMPDEFTMGEGSSSMNTHTTGGYIGHNDMYQYEGDGEGEPTYAALTWHLPSFKSDNGMSRETQRNRGLLIDKMVEEEIGEVADSDSTPSGLTLREGAPPPPWWLPYGFGGGILLFLIFMGLKSRSNGWH